MRLILFGYPYRIDPAPGTEPWRGWRFAYFGLEILEPCIMAEIIERELERGDDPFAPCVDEDTGEEFWYPLCSPHEPCRCCNLVRSGRVRHRHTGRLRGSRAIGRRPWRRRRR